MTPEPLFKFCATQRCYPCERSHAALRLHRLYLLPMFSYTPTFCASVHYFKPGMGNLSSADGQEKPFTHCSQHESNRIDYYIGLKSLKQSLYWFAHIDIPSLSPLCYVQSPGGTHHRLFIWRLPAGHGRRPAETASRHLSAGVCQARQETGVSHLNLPMQCSHQREPSKGQKGETGQNTHQTQQGPRFNFWHWHLRHVCAFQQRQLVVCRGGKAVGDCVLVAALVTPTSWSGACTGGNSEVRFLGETPLWQVKRSNWQHHVYWRRHTTVYSLPDPTVGSDQDH